MSADDREHDDEAIPPPSRPTTLTPAVLPGPVRDEETLLDTTPAGERYRFGKVLGVGGMGTVYLCRDRRVGRSVAMKVIDERRMHGRGRRRRFVGEARVQGQLQHPSIVPVYDLDRNAKGVDYFTMKRVSGNTVEFVIELLARGDPRTRDRFPLHRRLAVFRRLCQCIEYTHAAGVVHRDIKPGNVMIGDYGEVYLLDWGVAKVMAAGTTAMAENDDETESLTSAGQILGTPGYLSPEQAVNSQSVDERADVYALGAVLFELLTFEPLHQGRGVRALLHSARTGADARASERVPQLDIAPELDAVCVRATAQDPAERYPSVRELREALERYTEGERDVDLRRRLAARHASTARSLASHAAASRSSRHHTQALREASRALGLDPDCEPAQRLLMELLLVPPEQEPSEATRAREQEAADEVRYASRLASFAYGASMLLFPLLAWQGVRSWLGTALVFVPLVVAFVLAIWRARAPSTSPHVTLLMYFMGSLSIAASSGITGPLALTPALAAAHTISFGNTATMRPYRAVILLCGCATVLLPALLEWTGMLPRAYAFEHGRIIVTSAIIDLDPVASPITMFLVNVFAVVCPLLIVFRLGDDLEDKRLKLHEHLWNLAQLWPGAATLAGARDRTTRDVSGNPAAPRSGNT